MFSHILEGIIVLTCTMILWDLVARSTSWMKVVRWAKRLFAESFRVCPHCGESCDWMTYYGASFYRCQNCTVGVAKGGQP